MTEVDDYYQNLMLQAQRSNYAAQDDDPDDAAEALTLSQRTGVPAAAINDNLEDFQRQHRLALGNKIINDNEHIAEYLNSHPLAASVSSDDLAQLDNISRAADAFDNKTWVQKFHEFLNQEKGEYSLYTSKGREPFIQAFRGMMTPPEGFAEGFGPSFGQHPFGEKEGATPLEKVMGLYSRPSDIEFALSHPAYSAILGRAVGLGELGAEGMARVTNGLVGLGRENIANVFGEGTASVFDNAAQALIDPATQATLHGLGPAGAIPAGISRGAELFGNFLKAYRTIDRYRKIGKESPPGVDPIVDEAKEFQAKEDKQKLNDIITEVQKSATRERTPDLFLNNFLRRKLEGDIGLDAEAAKKLYGDEIPAPDDGKLGFIPGMAAQLENAKLTGDDIRVPLADWVTKVDPELHKELADDLRLRPEGFTINDTKLKIEPKEVIDDPLAQARGSAGLEPLAMAGDRKLTLEKIPPKEKTGRQIAEEQGLSWDDMSVHDQQAYNEQGKTRFGPEQGFHDIAIKDETGKEIGTINLSKQGKKLYVEMIQAGPKETGFYQPNFLGPALVKDMKRQLKAMFPDAETITGHRVSGAREKAGSFFDPSATPEVKLRLTDDPQPFRDLLQPYWEPISPHAQVLRGDFTPMQQAVADAVQAEAQRIIPEAVKAGQVEQVHAIHYPKAGGFTLGHFQPSTSKMFISLERIGVDPRGAVGERQLGSLRHEAIHWLYRNNLISDPEWATLTKAAQDENWRGQYRIDERYSNFSEAIRNEEAIAEAYRSWKFSEGITHRNMSPIFQKIADFMGRVRRRISTALGRELSWEDIFKEIDKGRVGRRELEEPGESEPLAMAPSGEGPGEFHPLYDKGKALGISDRSLRLREKLLQQAHAEDYQWDKRKNEARLQKTFRAEVKARRVTIRDEVRDNITQRPDVAIDQLFSQQKIKLDPATLSDEQKARLPKDYIQKKDGVNPDELAPYFGYASGDALVERLGMLTENRRSTGLSPRDYLNRLIDVETDRRLNQEFGEREANIHSDAAAQALSNTRLQLAHQDTLDYAAKAGAVATPAPEAGKTRYYHGTVYEDAKGFTGKTFVTPHYQYARDYHGGPNNILYADFTKDEAIQRGLWDEVNDRPMSTGSIDDGAAQLKRHVSPEEASKSGLKAPYSPEDMKTMAQKNFDGIAAGVVSKDSFMQNALRLSKKIEDADARGKWDESYRLMQKREFTLLHAKLAVGFEKLQDQVERFAKTYIKRPTKEVARRIDQDYYNFLQGLFARYGYRIGRTAEQLADAVEQGNYNTLPDLIRDKHQHLREIDAPEFVTNPDHPSFKKGLKDLTTEEYTQLHRFIKQMDFNARDEKKINVEGQAADLDDTIDRMIEGMPDSLPAKTISGEKKSLVKEIPKSLWWAHITIRSMAKRLDRGDPRGLFTRLIADRATQADATYSSLRRQYMKWLEDIGKKPDMDRIVENTLFRDPNTGELIPMRKRNVYAAIANWGNDSNRTKFLKGYGVEQGPAEAWLRQNSKPEDWEAHQAIGGVFAEVFKMASNMARDVSGVGIDALPLQKFTDPHGVEREGWYNPVEYHDMLPGKSKALLSAGAVEEPGYFRATTNQRYAKERTGYIAPMDLSLDAIPVRLDQMLHDIAWRPAIIDMGKIIENNKFANAVISRYGKHQMEEFKSFLRDMANRSNVNSLAEYYRETMLEYFRRNTVASLIGLNPSTLLKHSITAGMNSLTQVGPVNFSQEFVQMFRRTPEYAERQAMMAHEKSEVIQDRMQNITRLIRGTDPKFSFEPGKFGWWRETMMHVGSAPVAFGDLMTAVPTWLAEYKKQIAAGADEGFSIEAADKAVIEAHGSSLPSNLPSIARQGGAMARMYSSLYGFFSHILQKQYELGWKAKDIWNGEKPLDIGAGSWAPHMLNNLWSYWIFPALVEEAVSPWTNKEHESWGLKAAKWGLLGASSSLILVRDLARALLGAPGDPAPGVISASMKNITDLARDIERSQPLSRDHAGKLIKDAVSAAAVATGLTNAQEGRIGEYIYRYAHGLERPKGPWDLGVGLRYGKTEGHSRSFAEWWKYMTK